jgi:hypothetical protein
MAQKKERPMTETITQDDAQYALDLVRRICAEVGPGVTASPQERARAEIIHKEWRLMELRP